MTPEAQRIAIATYCGWEWGTPWGKKHVRFIAPKGYRSDNWRTSDPDNAIVTPLEGRTIEQARIEFIGGLPDYLNDLNACHEMEKALTDEQQQKFCRALFDLMPYTENYGPAYEGGPDLMLPSDFSTIHATAQQRCKAFLLTIGQWKE